MVFVFVFAVLGVLVAANWYLWRRLVRDTTSGPGWLRRGGALLIAGGWILAIAAFVAEGTGAPFVVQQILAWPGFLWLALSLYLLLAVLAGEIVRPLLRRYLERRRPATVPAAAPASDTATAPAAAPTTGVAPVTVPEAATEAHAVQGARPASATPTAATAEPSTRPAGDTPGTPSEPPTEPSTDGDDTPRHADGTASPRLVAAPSRRLFVSRVVAGAAAAAAVGTVGYGTVSVLNGPSIKRVTVPLAKLPRAAHGFRIAVVSDIHLGPVLGRGFAQRVVDTINSTQPDLIAVVGDLVDGSVKDLGPAAAPLAGLRARHGTYYVTGNHEYFSGAEQWVDEVRRLGMTPLENARTELPYFDLAGVNDVAGEDEGQGPDFVRALGDRDRSRTSVLLAHQPVQIHDAVDHGVDLQLSGHTHGGQLWPGTFLAGAANPTVAGLERYGDTQLYVSRGAGAWGPPTRVGAESDITVIQLAAREA